MDLNELLHAHQVAVMRASADGNDQTRDNHFAKVAEYAERVRQMREGYAANAKPAPVTITITEPETVIYGTYIGPLDQPSAAMAVDSWEDEGGALDTPDASLPDGVTYTDVRHYHVGPYVYQDLDRAVAEHLRQLSEQAGD